MENSVFRKPTCVDGKSKIQLRLVDDSMFLSKNRPSLTDSDSLLSLRLNGSDATALILSDNKEECPSYVKMDAYIDEDLLMDSWTSECGESVSWLGDPPRVSLSSPSLCSEQPVFPFYSPKAVRRKDLQDMLPKQPAMGLNMSNFLGPAQPSKPPRCGEWKNLLAHWTDPSNPPSNLKDLLRAGCPQELRAHAWNLLIIRRTTVRRRITQYASAQAAGLKWANSKEGRTSLEVKQINDLMIHTPEPALASQLRVRRVMLALLHSLRISEFRFIHRLVTAVLPILNDNEEATFWAMVALHDSILPKEYFKANSDAAERDGKILWNLLQIFAPELYRILINLPGGNSNKVLASVTTKWRQTVFLDCFQSQLVWRLWDVLWFEGERMLFRFQMALFRVLQPLLSCLDSVDGVEKLLLMAGDLVHDVEAVTVIATEELGNITDKLLTKLRRKSRP